MMDPKLQLQQPEFRPTGSASRSRQRQRSNRRTSSGAGAAASAAAVAPGRVNAVGIPGQYMQPVRIRFLMLFGLFLNASVADSFIILHHDLLLVLCSFTETAVRTSLPGSWWNGFSAFRNVSRSPARCSYKLELSTVSTSDATRFLSIIFLICYLRVAK